jgi:hypothetical protein
MRYSLDVTGLGVMDTGLVNESEEQRMEREAKEKAEQDH